MSNIWDDALSLLQIDTDIKKVFFETILSKMKLEEYKNNIVILTCRDEYSLNIVKNSLSKNIEKAVHLVTGSNPVISYIIEGDDKARISTVISVNKAISRDTEDRTMTNSTLSPNYTFENFIVGNCNRYAHAASIRVADKQGQPQFNPLFLWGNSGLGKTHLMQAIGNRIQKNNPNKRIVYVTCEKFMNDYVESIRKNDYTPFRDYYRNTDVLLIDDIQFLISKEGLQQEFFNTFEALINQNKQIVITSDKAPSNLVSLEERLTSRFQNGYTMDVQPPDFETRKAILVSKINNDGINVSEELIDYISENATSNIRQINGAYNVISSLYALNSTKVVMEDAISALNNFFSPNNAQKLTPEIIINVISQYYGISIDKIKSKNRNKDIIIPRNVTCYLLRELLEMQYTKIGEFLGGRDHSTMMNSHEKVSADENLLLEIEDIKRSLPT